MIGSKEEIASMTERTLKSVFRRTSASAIAHRLLTRAVLTSPWRIGFAMSLVLLACGVSGLRGQQGDQVYKSGDTGVAAPKLTHKVDAQYSPNAQARGIMGDVTL